MSPKRVMDADEIAERERLEEIRRLLQDHAMRTGSTDGCVTREDGIERTELQGLLLKEEILFHLMNAMYKEGGDSRVQNAITDALMSLELRAQEYYTERFPNASS